MLYGYNYLYINRVKNNLTYATMPVFYNFAMFLQYCNITILFGRDISIYDSKVPHS